MENGPHVSVSENCEQLDLRLTRKKKKKRKKTWLLHLFIGEGGKNLKQFLLWLSFWVFLFAERQRSRDDTSSAFARGSMFSPSLKVLRLESFLSHLFPSHAPVNSSLL